MKIFVISDTHFHHKNIIEYSNRSFKNVEEMDNEMIKRGNNKVGKEDEVIYTLVLRIRTLYLIQCLISKKNYSKNEFITLIERISGNKEVYKRYLIIKNNSEKKSVITIEETKKLYDYLANQLVQVKELVKKLDK